MFNNQKINQLCLFILDFSAILLIHAQENTHTYNTQTEGKIIMLYTLITGLVIVGFGLTGTAQPVDVQPSLAPASVIYQVSGSGGVLSESVAVA